MNATDTTTRPRTPRGRDSRPPGVGAPRNPFATSFVEPGRLDWVDDGGADLVSLALRLDGPGRWQVRGRQGTGKTTLLVHLVRRAARTQGRPAFLIHKPWSELRSDTRIDLPPGALLAVDGFDNSPFIAQLRARSLAARTRATLLVSTHRPLLGFRTLHRRRASRDLALHLTATLAPAGEEPPAPHDVDTWLRRPEAVRTVLREMYDRWERDHAAGTGTATSTPTR